MIIHPKEYFKVLKHISQEWKNGCHCQICHSVDLREQVKFSRLDKK